MRSTSRQVIGYLPHGPEGKDPVDRRRGGRIVAELQTMGHRVLPYQPLSEASYDLVIISGLRGLDQIIEDRRRRPHCFFVLDQADAHLISAGPHLRPISRLMVGLRMVAGTRLGVDNWYRKLAELVRLCDLITVGSEVQAESYRTYNRRVCVIPDVMDEEYGGQVKVSSHSSPCRLVWEGFGENVLHFEVVRCALEQLNSRHELELAVFSNENIPKYFRNAGPVGDYLGSLPCRTRYAPWDQARCAEDLLSGDIAIIPIDLRNRFAAAKPVNKLNTMRMMGLPVVATPTPAYRDSIEDGVDGYLAGSTAEWVAKLDALISDPHLRQMIGSRGRERALGEAVFERVFKRWLAILPL